MGKGPKDIEETEEQIAAAAVAREKWDHYNETYVPVENEYMARVGQMDEDWQHDMATGGTAKQYSEAFDDAAQDSAAAQLQSGADPTSGRFSAGLADVRTSEASATADGMVTADQNQESRYVGGVRNIVSMGQGVAADAQMGLQDVANRSASDAAYEATNKFRSSQDTQTMMGMAAGAGLEYGLNQDDRKGA